MARHEKTPTTQYIETTFAHEPEGFAEVRSKGEELRAGMAIGALEGKLLSMLVALCRPKVILEIGTFVGYSALWMARELPDGGRILTLEKNVQHAATAREFFRRFSPAPIEVIEGDALENLAALPADLNIDMVFIDAQKNQYVDYLDLVLPHLQQGGLIVADNTLLWGLVHKDAPEDESSLNASQWRAMRIFNERLADPERFTSILIPTTEGMTVARKK